MNPVLSPRLYAHLLFGNLDRKVLAGSIATDDLIISDHNGPEIGVGRIFAIDDLPSRWRRPSEQGADLGPGRGS